MDLGTVATAVGSSTLVAGAVSAIVSLKVSGRESEDRREALSLERSKHEHEREKWEHERGQPGRDRALVVLRDFERIISEAAALVHDAYSSAEVRAEGYEPVKSLVKNIRQNVLDFFALQRQLDPTAVLVDGVGVPLGQRMADMIEVAGEVINACDDGKQTPEMLKGFHSELGVARGELQKCFRALG